MAELQCLDAAGEDHRIQLHGILPVQVITAELMQHWEKGQELEAHVTDIQVQYGRRASVMLQAADKHLRGLAEWVGPRAGMFLWLRLLHCPDADDVVQDLVDAGVVVLPGERLHCKTGRYCRARFASSLPVL